MKKVVFFLIFSFFYTAAQQGIGTWNTKNINFKLNKNWQFFVEGQIRSLSFYNNFHYYEIKGGATYNITENINIASGVGTYNTFNEIGNFAEPAKQREIRTMLQITFKNKFDVFSLEHRYRAEQRFTNNGYKNRFRYRISANFPVFKNVFSNSKPFILTWNELFFTNNEPFFERNRSFLGVGLNATKNLVIQTGYTYQFDYKINDEIGRDFLNLSFLYSFNLKDKNK